MLFALLMSVHMLTGSGPMDAALQATEAPKSMRVAFTVELQSTYARRVYAFDPRETGDERWRILEWVGEDEELERFAANWASEAAPDGRLFPDDLRASLGRSVDVNKAGHAWQLQFKHTPSSNDDDYDIWAAERLAATAWLDPVGERFLRIDYQLPAPVPGPDGGKLTKYNQSYFLRTEPHWGMSYVSGFAIELEARAGYFHKIQRRYSANIVKTEFFFSSAESEAAFQKSRLSPPQVMSDLVP